MTGYWTIILPPLPMELNATADSIALAWYPDGSAALTRGAFGSPTEAWDWAVEHLRGLPWELKHVPPVTLPDQDFT